MLAASGKGPALELLHSNGASGEDHPAILFIHGYTSGAWQFAEHWMPALCAMGWQSYALNLRGHGKSEGREIIRKARFADYAQGVLITALRPKSLIRCSYLYRALY